MEKKRDSKRSRHNEALESGLSTSNKNVKRPDLPREFEESFVARNPFGLRIHKSTMRITYVETNSILVNRAFVGDKIVAVDGQKIENTQQLNKLLSNAPLSTIRVRHAYFSYCQYNCTTVERLQLDKDVFKSTGRAIDLYSVYLQIPRDLDETQRVLKWSVKYDNRERIQIAHVDPNGLAAIHMRPGDVIREVNEHPIASKSMLRHWICEAIEGGRMVHLSIERQIGEDARDQIETPADVIEIAQKQIQEIKARAVKATPPSSVLVHSRHNSKLQKKLKFTDKPAEVLIQADHDPLKLKPCRMAKH